MKDAVQQAVEEGLPLNGTYITIGEGLSVTISGEGGGVVLDAKGAGRHFYVGGALALEGLTLSNGANSGVGFGGAIYVGGGGSLTATKCVFSKNKVSEWGSEGVGGLVGG